jgi:hypothetical protein
MKSARKSAGMTGLIEIAQKADAESNSSADNEILRERHE